MTIKKDLPKNWKKHWEEYTREENPLFIKELYKGAPVHDFANIYLLIDNELRELRELTIQIFPCTKYLDWYGETIEGIQLKDKGKTIQIWFSFEIPSLSQEIPWRLRSATAFITYYNFKTVELFVANCNDLIKQTFEIKIY
jgi:hypothetical protein